MTPQAALVVAEALDHIWPRMDSAGRTFRAALTSALARAARHDWTTSDDSVWDFRAMSLFTPIAAAVLKDHPTGSDIGVALTVTNDMLAKKAGYKGQSVDEVKSQASGETRAWIEYLLVALAVLAIAAIVLGTAYFLFSNGKEVIEYQLALDKCQQILAERQAAMQKLVADHLDREAKNNNGPLPWSDAEKQAYADLQQAQRDVVAGVCPGQPGGKKPEDTSVWLTPWPYLGISAVALGILGYVYRAELKSTVKRLTA